MSLNVMQLAHSSHLHLLLSCPTCPKATKLTNSADVSFMGMRVKPDVLEGISQARSPRKSQSLIISQHHLLFSNTYNSAQGIEVSTSSYKALAHLSSINLIMGFNPDSLPDLTGKVYIVTGGNSGMYVSPPSPSHHSPNKPQRLPHRLAPRLPWRTRLSLRSLPAKRARRYLRHKKDRTLLPHHPPTNGSHGPRDCRLSRQALSNP